MKSLLIATLIIVLLYVPASAQPALCPDAPLPRLAEGQQAEVVVDRLRLRALPAVGTGEVRLLNAGTRVGVMAGPSCNGGYAWWRVELENGTTGWAAEGTWESYYLRPVSDAPLPICDRAEAPWLYLVVQLACTMLEL